MSGSATTAPKIGAIQIANSERVRQAIYSFRYWVYVKEMGKKPLDADHKKHLITDELDESSTLFYVENESQIVATLRINTWTETPLSEKMIERYNLYAFLKDHSHLKLSYSSRLMIHPNYRGSSLIGKLLNTGYNYLRDNGVFFDFCHCSPSLVPFYEQLGHRRYTDNFQEPQLGYRVPMVLLLEDVAHLRLCRSAFWRAARKRENSDHTANWFNLNFTKHAKPVNARLMPLNDFWDVLGEKMRQDPQHAIPLFNNLSKENAQTFLKAATVIHCRKGDYLIQPGEVGQEMFVIISGMLDIEGRRHGRESISIASLGPGQIVGEISFITQAPRTAYVKAVDDTEVLILTPSFLEKMMRTLPHITVKVLFNLAAILSDRLRTNTMDLLNLTAIKAGLASSFSQEDQEPKPSVEAAP